MRHLPPLNALRAFEAAGRHESFAAAAEELAVSHSSISRHVRGLEDRLGVALFVDLPRGVRLTDRGAAYLAEVTPALDRISDATLMLADQGKGVVTVSCEPIFASHWLVTRLADFTAKAPQVELRLDSTPELADVRRHAADLAIRYFKTGVPDQPTDLISDRPMRVFATPELAAQVSQPLDLLRMPRLQDRSGDTWGAWFAIAGVETGTTVTEPEWRMRAALSLEMALAGQGAILISEEIVLDLVGAGRLVPLFDAALYQGSYHLVQGEAARRAPAVRMFRSWLLDVTSDLRRPAVP